MSDSSTHLANAIREAEEQRRLDAVAEAELAEHSDRIEAEFKKGKHEADLSAEDRRLWKKVCECVNGQVAHPSAHPATKGVYKQQAEQNRLAAEARKKSDERRKSDQEEAADMSRRLKDRQRSIVANI